MLGNLASKLFGSRNERLIKQLMKNVKKINALEANIEAMSDEQLQAKTQEFRNALQNGKTLDDILPVAFAVVREASKRVLGMRHYDVQLLGGMVLHMGKIAEMRTGEGKTLVATLAVYLNALEGKGVHVVTVNDYLAKRDGEELGKLYAFLGLSTGIILSGMHPAEKQAAYAADITYGTNNEFGFDYLRTNMARFPEERLQRELNFAIVDEVDSILIDEARTPLIISGAADMDVEMYRRLDAIVPFLTKQESEDSAGDFTIDEKTKQVGLSEAGHDHVEALLVEHGLIGANESLYDPKNIGLFHHLNACLRAHHLYHKDVDYIVRDDEVMIVDEFTGRIMDGRRWSGGLHQAIEIKEGVSVKQETQTLASITYQNYFRQYKKLSGMTGTADTEAFEFQSIYNLETVVIPTNRPVQRKDYTDRIFLNQDAKFRAIIEEVKECREKRQPVLLGTASIEASELLSDYLRQEDIVHEVLNAKQHEREAEIIANAGRPGQVTIATNMAGRGTDIVLGGNLKAELGYLGENASDEARQEVIDAWQKRHDEVLASGGLHVIGTERHESRRIDNQLRGRSGRQGDPGSSRFYVALDDNLVRIFAGDRMKAIMQRLGMSENEAIESRMVSKQIEGSQRKVEAHNFDARKSLLEYDDVANEQRKIIYQQRNEMMDADDISERIDRMREAVVERLIQHFTPVEQPNKFWDLEGLENVLVNEFSLAIDFKEMFSKNPNMTTDEVREKILDALRGLVKKKQELYGAETWKHGEHLVALEIIDHLWKEHLATMDMLRQSIWMRSRAQKDPKQEYQREAFELFEQLFVRIQDEIVRYIAQLNLILPEGWKEAQEAQDQAVLDNAIYQSSDEDGNPQVQFAGAGRNDPCPCGSGKRFKDCHGKL